jgi:signal transduction histidine kinase/CheY-like chemotaxis protein
MASGPSGESKALAEAARVQQTVQEAIVSDVLTLMVPLSTVLCLAAVVAMAFTGQPFRVASALLALVQVAGARFALRRGWNRLATGLLLGALMGTSVFGMVFNGGMEAPAAPLLVVSLVVVGWMFGRRGATVAAALACAAYLLIGGLERAHLLREVLPVPPLAHAVVFCLLVALAWSATANPYGRMRATLVEAIAHERALHLEQERRLATDLAFEAIFDQTVHLLVLVDAGGRVVKANRVALEFLGAGLVAGQPLPELPGWPPVAREALEAALAYQKVAPFTVRTGSRALDFSISPHRDDAGVLRYLIVEGRDVTELLAAQERRSQARRLELVGQLAGGVAHDFNNVLAAILTSTELLQADLAGTEALTPDVEESLDTISTMGQRASDLTRRLLSFGRRQPLEPRVLSLHELITSTVRLLTRTLPASIHVQTELVAEGDLVRADAAAVESVLLNLAVNARDAMPEGGALTLRTEVVTRDAAWCAASGFELAPGPYVCLSVRDTGCGIAPELLGRVFEPFFSTKAEGHGTGIGLASVFAAMRDHGGAVHVRSEVGQGTEFTLHFPRSSEAPVARAAASVERDFAGLHALLVDDEPSLRQSGARLLEQLGVSSVTAPDAEAGLAAFQQAPERFDFAVLDVVLPGRRGSELALDLLAASPKLRVLLVTGFPKDAELSRLPRERVALLAKPFTLEAFRSALAALLPAPQPGSEGASRGDDPDVSAVRRG